MFSDFCAHRTFFEARLQKIKMAAKSKYSVKNKQTNKQSYDVNQNALMVAYIFSNKALLKQYQSSIISVA